MLQFFWITDKDGKLEMSPEAEEEYFVFIFEFCSCTSHHWKNYLKVLMNCPEGTFRNKLTKSDEAFTAWYLFNSAKTLESYIEKSAFEGKFKTPKGHKYACYNYDVYTELHNRVEHFRKNEAAYNELQKRMFLRYFKKEEDKVNMKISRKQEGIPYSEDWS